LVIAGPSILANTWDELCESARRHFGRDAIPDASAMVDELVPRRSRGARRAVRAALRRLRAPS
jgi:hypothetical protein